MTSSTTPNTVVNLSVLSTLSADLVALVDATGSSTVRVEDGSRLTATGLIWSADGLVVTTSHGLERDTDIEIELSNGSISKSTLVGRDPETDIALLRVNTPDEASSQWHPVNKTNHNVARVGSLVVAIGRPGRSGLHSTLGMVSARIDSQQGDREEYLLHTDAMLYPGFSGGGLFGSDGTLYGMIDLIYGRGKGIALGIPIIERSVANLLKSGKVQRPYLGIRTQQANLPTNLKEGLGLEQDHGLIIIQVEPGTSAESAHLLLGDTLLKLNGKATPDVDALRSALQTLEVGQTIDLQILRGGELRDVQATLGAAA